ncbi:glutamine-dependent NAD(+) synthetase [Anopheles bellator]|uniref:glutamine-dependent NAD(+) synthetase n=1 Tax=Anopheles bellator TaxID=139047 RepID=UPI002648ECA0|nr:glutamine-dependent NAD(+) synthetase [Anopheles bellator]
MGKQVRVAVCTLNQWALDFQGNLQRIMESILVAVKNKAAYRTGPELEVSGYSCEDHFHELDTFRHCWDALQQIVESTTDFDMLIDVGMPVHHRNVAYNCRIAFYRGRILLIRPKQILCDDGNYRESRWFSPWTKERQVEDFRLPRSVAVALRQDTVPIGDGVIVTHDTCLGYEICEELWNPRSKHIDLSLAGVEIIVNGSGSYMELRKAHVTTDLIRNASYKAGGAYLFSNLRGCDGQRVYFNGCSAVALNGAVIARGQQFALDEVEVTFATFDLDDIQAYRGALRSRSLLAASTLTYPSVLVRTELSRYDDLLPEIVPPPSLLSPYHTPEEEISLGPACWLWDYLRRSGQGGFFLPLSGGVDSSSTAVIVYSMCRLVVRAIAAGDPHVLADCRKVLADPEYDAGGGAAELCNRLLFTCYMGTENSSRETRARAASLAGQIHCYHLDINIDGAVNTLLGIFQLVTGMRPRFRSAGGCARENLALQNIQARTRMVLAYLFAQLMLWVRSRPGGLLVLGSSNVDEALRGYMTKYDCSSADVNPIGGISKKDLQRFLAYAQRQFELPIITEILVAPPTAELEPLVDGALAQTDEEDMGLTYRELSEFGRLRKQEHCGPYSMFCKLLRVAGSRRTDCDPKEIADKVKHFFRCYAINRHKMTVLTPSVHAESYSPDDNRFDHRPFLYRPNWMWQFAAIDRELLRQTSSDHTLLIKDHTHKNEEKERDYSEDDDGDDEVENGDNGQQRQTSYRGHSCHGNPLATQPHISYTTIAKGQNSYFNDADVAAGGSVTTGVASAVSAHQLSYHGQTSIGHLYLAAHNHDVAIGSGLTKSQSSSGYNRVHSSVMGKIKDRTGVPV